LVFSSIFFLIENLKFQLNLPDKCQKIKINDNNYPNGITPLAFLAADWLATHFFIG